MTESFRCQLHRSTRMYCLQAFTAGSLGPASHVVSVSSKGTCSYHWRSTCGLQLELAVLPRSRHICRFHTTLLLSDFLKQQLISSDSRDFLALESHESVAHRRTWLSPLG